MINSTKIVILLTLLLGLLLDLVDVGFMHLFHWMGICLMPDLRDRFPPVCTVECETESNGHHDEKLVCPARRLQP